MPVCAQTRTLWGTFRKPERPHAPKRTPLLIDSRFVHHKDPHRVRHSNEHSRRTNKSDNDSRDSIRRGRATALSMPNRMSTENDLLLVSYEVETCQRITNWTTQRSPGTAKEDYYPFCLSLRTGPLSPESIKNP